MKEGRITEECWIELYHTCKSVLDNHGDDPEAAKAWAEKVFESCENISRQVHELFLKAIDLIHDLEKKKAANPHADQSKGLTAPNTTGTGCHNNYTTEVGRLSIGKCEDTVGEIRYCPMWSGVPYTTAAARNQEGRNGNE